VEQNCCPAATVVPASSKLADFTAYADVEQAEEIRADLLSNDTAATY
jgi:hypothetical protein